MRTRLALLLLAGVLAAGAMLGGWAWKKQAGANVPAPVPDAALELAPADLARVELSDIAEGIEVSGSLRALQSATVRARVAGELQSLSVREGDAVRAGQVIAQVDPTESQARLRQAREQADAALAQIQIAQRQYDNNRALVDQGFISRTALDTSQSSLAAAKATHQAAVAAVDLAAKALQDTALRSPIAGWVSQRLVQAGERVSVDARIVEIVDPARLELEATLAAADSMRLRVGQSARLSVAGAPAPVMARVDRINPSTQAGSRSIVAYLAVDGAPGLRHGMFAQGRIEADMRRVAAVPLDAVRTDKPSPYVQAVENGRVQHRPVQPGVRAPREGQTWVAVDGLAPGLWVLRGHVGALQPGAAVKPPPGGDPRP